MLKEGSSISDALSSPDAGMPTNPKLKLPRAVRRTGSVGGTSSSPASLAGPGPPVSVEDRLARAVLLELEVRRKDSHWPRRRRGCGAAACDHMFLLAVGYE